MEDLKKKGYLKEEIKAKGPAALKITTKTERALRKNAMQQLFGNIKKSGSGSHKSKKSGQGDKSTGEFRNFQFGDSIEQISITESLKNAQINHGIGEFKLSEEDLIIEDTHHKSQMSTVLMIDISHSMILYGEDRITPAKKVAMALAELITTRYPKDTLDVIVFGNDAWPIKIKDLPYLQVGPYHTNTVAGLAFLGVGIRPPTAEWGVMVAEGANDIATGFWWTSLAPGFLIVIASMAFHLIGDQLSEETI